MDDGLPQSSMKEQNPQKQDHQARSSFVRRLVQEPLETSIPALSDKTPRRIVQFWNDLSRLPEDVVGECIQSWQELKEQGYEVLLFGESQAREYIRQRLGSRYVMAFNACYHPAMQSDYFRLCYILKEGGCYVDADDVFHNSEIDHLFRDGLLKIQPLCYDTSTGEMVPPAVFTVPGANASSWIFYFNNNPLISSHSHPILELALTSATTSLLQKPIDHLPDIQSTTGPGNLTKSIFDAATANSQIVETLQVQRDWEDIATSKWDLSYRDDHRNWRLSNGRAYSEETG